MTFTDLMLSNYKTEIRVRKLNHNDEENIILKFETDHSMASVFLNETQVEELLKKLYETLTGQKTTTDKLEFVGIQAKE